MATHIDDEEQVENLKRWWKENWKALAAGLALGFSVIGGWNYWKGHTENSSATASQMYDDMKKALAANRADEAKQIGDKLRDDYSRTPYAATGALVLAQKAVQDNRLDDAAEQLAWVTEHSKDEGLQKLAKLRQARVLWQQGKTGDALARLDGDAGAYQSLYDELRGDIQLMQGDRAAARSAYEKALASAGTEQANRDLLQRKLDDLAIDDNKANS